MRGLLAMGLLVAAATPAAAFDFERGVGIVDVEAGGRACLDIATDTLRVGQRIVVVTLEKPQAALVAEVVAPSGTSCRGEANHRPGDAHYRLRLPRGAPEAILALAVLAPPPAFRVQRGLVQADLDGDGRRAFFRSCASTEGVHLTVWADAPLARRQFHAYHYLAYDVEPTCTEADTRP